MFFTVITKNLVALKDGMGLRMKNLNITRVHRKIRFLSGEWGGGLHEKRIQRGHCLKKQRGDLDSLQI